MSLFHADHLPTIAAITTCIGVARHGSRSFPRVSTHWTRPRIEKAQEAFWKGELDEAGLRAVGRELRQAHWALQKQAGIELLPAGDFAWYDQVLTHSLMFGVVPERFRPADGQATLHTLFAMARGVSDPAAAVPMPRK